MANLDELIALATRHVTEGRRIVQSQKQLTAECRAGPHGNALLATFEKSQEIFEGDLNRLLRERDANRNRRNERSVAGVVDPKQEGDPHDQAQTRQAE